MRGAIFQDFADAIKAREHHFFILSGNVYDTIPIGPQKFDDVIEFLIMLTEEKFPQCFVYDLFSGIRVVRGNEYELRKAMGLIEEQDAKTRKESKDSKDSNADLVQALKKAKEESSGKFPLDPLEVLQCFEKLFAGTSAQTVLIVEYADALVPAGVQNANQRIIERMFPIALTKWSRSSAIRDKGHLIFLIARRASDLDEAVLDRAFETAQFRIPKPSEEERVHYFEESSLDSSFVRVFAKATSGLSFRELGRIYRHCAGIKNLNLETALAHVFQIKQKALRDEYSDILEIMPAKNGFDAVGGLEKSIVKLREVAQAMREGKTSLCPQGILFEGPPGTGKTLVAEALAKEAGLNCVKPLDIKNMWLGESERRMTRFLNAVQDLAPVLVFIDEFDQNQAQRGGFDGDSGTSRNLLKKMLEAMSDTSWRGKVLWVLATNRPDLIDPAMKRPGRCDLRITFLPADEKQLALISQAAFRQYPDMRSDIQDWMPYAQRCKGYNGSEMVEVVRRAWVRANTMGRDSISDEDMAWACDDFIPHSVNRLEVIHMTLLSLADCSSKELLPDNWEEVFEGCVQELKECEKEAAFKDLLERIEKSLKGM